MAGKAGAAGELPDFLESVLEWGMTNPCPPHPSEKLLAIESEFKIRNRINMHEQLDRLLKDPEKNMGHIETLIRMLDTMEKQLIRNRELSLGEWRLEVRQEAMALQRTKMDFQRQQAPKQSPGVAGLVEGFSGPVSPKEVPNRRARSKKAEQPQPKITPGEIEPENNASPSVEQRTVSSKASEGPKGEVSATSTRAPIAEERSTAELQAMEWDLRGLFNFGDLRPFEFCTGSQTIRFPDRTSHPEAAEPNFPVGFHPSSDNQRDAGPNNQRDAGLDNVPRADEYVIVPHVLPSGFTKAEAKSKPELAAQPEDARPVRRQRTQPIFKDDGTVDWGNFVTPLCSGVWPENTVLPKTWQYEDPIPGGLGEEVV